MRIKISKARIFTLRLYPGTICRMPRIRIIDESTGMRTFIEFDTMSDLSISDQAALYLNGMGIRIGSYLNGVNCIYLIEVCGYSEQDIDDNDVSDFSNSINDGSWHTSDDL